MKPQSIFNSDNTVRKYTSFAGVSKGMRRYLNSTMRRGLNPQEVAIFKAADKNAFQHVDEKGRVRGAK